MTSDLATPRRAPTLAPRRSDTRKRRTRSPMLTVMMSAALIYFLFPLFWIVVASTKTTGQLFSTFGMWFADDLSLVENIRATLTYDGGIFGRWMLNTLLYSGVSAVAATFICALGGYGFAKYRFRGNDGLFMSVLGAIMVPATALAVPTYLLFSEVDLVNTPWAIILPSLVSPFGLYLMRIYADTSVSDSLIEAARIDGASELRIFFSVGLRLLGPGLVTVFLFTLVHTWNNYFLPLIMFNTPELYPVTVGLAAWSSQTAGGAGSTGSLIALVITGSLLSIIPLIIAFLFLQRYWQSGLAAGSVKQ